MLLTALICLWNVRLFAHLLLLTDSHEKLSAAHKFKTKRLIFSFFAVFCFFLFSLELRNITVSNFKCCSYFVAVVANDLNFLRMLHSRNRCFKIAFNICMPLSIAMQLYNRRIALYQTKKLTILCSGIGSLRLYFIWTSFIENIISKFCVR